MREQVGVVDPVLKLEVKPPGQQQIVQTRSQQQQILQIEAGGHQAEIHIGTAVIPPHRSRAIERNHSGSDVDLCLVAPSLQLEDLLLLGARLDDLLLPWRFDLQLQHRIDHPELLAHIERVGVALL